MPLYDSFATLIAVSEWSVATKYLNAEKYWITIADNLPVSVAKCVDKYPTYLFKRRKRKIAKRENSNRAKLDVGATINAKSIANITCETLETVFVKVKECINRFCCLISYGIKKVSSIFF